MFLLSHCWTARTGGALFKISSVHVTTVTALKGKKKSGEFKTFIYNHIKYVTVHEYATNIE